MKTFRHNYGDKYNEIIATWPVVKLTARQLRLHMDTNSHNLGKCLTEIREWCDSYESSKRYYCSLATFYFEDPADATIFTLRWA